MKRDRRYLIILFLSLVAVGCLFGVKLYPTTPLIPIGWQDESMNECAFCKIANGEAPASVVFSDEKIVAFLDIQPVNPGHVLVIPRAHAKALSELEPEVGGQLFKAAMVVADGLRRSGLKCEGVNLFLADGEAAFQDVFHVHLHVIPRFRGDGFGLKFGSDYGNKPERQALDVIADQVKRAISK